MANREKLTRQKVIDAALTLCDEKGFDALTLAEIAKFLGIKPPSLYNHIENLDALKQQIGLQGLNAFYDVIAASAFGKSGSEALFAVADAYIQFVHENNCLYRAMTRVPDTNEPAYAALNQKLVSMLTQLAAYFVEDETDRLHCVRGLRSLLHGFASIQLEGGFRMTLPQRESLHYALAVYIRGLESDR
jgi:AcrR family transcriptional regulator